MELLHGRKITRRVEPRFFAQGLQQHFHRVLKPGIAKIIEACDFGCALQQSVFVQIRFRNGAHSPACTDYAVGDANKRCPSWRALKRDCVYSLPQRAHGGASNFHRTLPSPTLSAASCKFASIFNGGTTRQRLAIAQTKRHRRTHHA